MTDPPIWPAATLIVMRDAADGPPDILMVERAGAMAFAAGALVFPGGRVDEGDRAAALLLGAADVDDTAARIAAIRETIEEAGLAIGVREPGPVEPLRAALYGGSPVAEAIGVDRLDLDVLVPFGRWLPRGVTHKLFDTRFYLARAPTAADPVVDGNENVRLFWASAQSVVDDAAAGRARLIFPTRRNLERLATYPDFAAAAADARRYPIRAITPWIERAADGDRLCIPDDLGYPVISEPLAGAMRA